MTEIDELLKESGLVATDQRIGWDFDTWRATLAGAVTSNTEALSSTLQDLEDRWALDGGISRAAVVEVGRRDPLRLLVASMAWGFGPVRYGPARVLKMLATPGLEQTLADIQTAAGSGAALAWGSLFHKRRPRVKGLSVAMGSKYLYFAVGGLAAPAGSPIIYDQNVYWALTNLEGGLRDAPNPRSVVTSADYEATVHWVESKASEHGLRPDDVEYRLFQARSWLRRRDRLQAMRHRTSRPAESRA